MYIYIYIYVYYIKYNIKVGFLELVNTHNNDTSLCQFIKQ